MANRTETRASLEASPVTGKRAVSRNSPPIGDYVYGYGARIILETIKKMVKTQKPPVPYEQMITRIAIAEAARLAQKQGKRVFVKDVL